MFITTQILRLPLKTPVCTTNLTDEEIDEGVINDVKWAFWFLLSSGIEIPKEKPMTYVEYDAETGAIIVWMQQSVKRLQDEGV